ncbi:transmembrane protein, putative (macronuclear) [Tetrahymena thermophila SB210]|uniref:Transmembrane protein, putative n=1 Tax=Tetrahymena thermophila (strain SB210) TaxID=312017 RepID=Q22WS0_TETTS|nr:transmembrane protein, putative [Tetrahymena thermophila SB210]EAR89722.2 transmembrane protein, putative [Tetrahymena thermophila SB210]|eukprot:XP_001009967.2 transmembrane protein, putative [Tetrahymena thermophila SB210]
MKLKYIKEIDVFGPKIELRLGDKKTHKTLCGATMTLFVVACSITAVILIGKELIQKDSPSVSFQQILAYESNNEISSNVGSFGSFSQISLNDIQFMVGITDLQGQEISKDIIDKLQIQIYFVQKDGNNYQKTPIQTEQCKSDSFQNYNISDFNPSNYLCLSDNQQFEAWGYDTDFKAQYFEVSVQCKTTQCLQSCCQYQKLKLNLLYQDQYFSPNKYAQCYTPIYNSKYIEFNLLQNGVDGSQDYDLILQKSTVVTDQGWLTSTFEKSNYVIINELAQSLNSNVDFVLSLRISVHPLRLIYQRSYLKVQGLLAVVGGLLKTLILIGRVLVKPIAKLSMNSELVNELFVFEDQRNRRLRKSLEKQMQQSDSDDSDSSEIYKKEENKFKKEYVLKELDQQNYYQDSEANQELNSNQQAYGQYLQPKQLDKKTLQLDNQYNQNEYMFQKQRLYPADYQVNDQENNNNFFKIDYVDQLKGINQIKQRESIIDSKNVSSIQKAKLNLKNSIARDKDLFSYNTQQNFNTQNQIQQKENQNYQITINDSDKKKKYSAINTPKSKFLQENLAQQNKFESSAFKRVRTRSNSQTSKKQFEIIIGQEQKQAVQEMKGELNLNSIDQQNIENKQEDQQDASDANHQEQNLDPGNEENRIFNARRANKYLTAEVSQNQYNSIKVDDSLKVFQSVKQNVNLQKQQDHSNQQQQQQPSKPNLQNKPNLFKRKGTTIITEILQKNYLVQRGMRKTTVKEQNEDNARFSNELENMQEKPLRFTCIDYIKYYFSQLKCLSKKKQIKYSVKKVTERFDIIYILQKLVEIDKLKVLLLSYEQQKLFEYMPKPVVQTDPEKQENNLMLGRMNADLQQNWTLLNSEKGNLDKFTEAFHAYKQIQMKQEKEPLDERLIMMLDPDVKRYFDITKADGSQVVTPNKNSRKVSMIPLKFNVPDQGQGLKQSIMLARSQMQQLRLQQQKDEVRMRLTSSYIENDCGQDNQQKQEDNQIIDLQQSNKFNHFYEKEENKNMKNRISQKYKENIQFQPLLAPSGDVNSPKSTQQFIQSQTMFSQQPSNQNKNTEQRINHLSCSGEQIEENIQGKTSYPRESICLNQADYMENNNQYSKLSTLSLKDNQFSFARKSIESPLFLFDPQKKNLLKLSSIKNMLMPVSQTSLSIRNSNQTMISQKDENQESLNKKDLFEQQQFYQISPYSFLQNKKSQKKRRCQSQHDLENISEQQENEYQNQLFVQLGNPKNISFGNQALILSNENTNDKNDQSLKRLIVLNNSDETQANEMIHFDDKKLYEQLLISKQINQEFSQERKDKKHSQDYNSEINIINNKFRKNSESNHNNTPPLQAHRQNSPNLSHLIPQHRKNTNSVGSQNSLFNIKKESLNLNGSNSQALKDSPILDFDNNFLSLHHPRLFFVNPFNRNITSQNQEQNNEVSAFNRESIKNNGVNKINSNQSFQSIPEEYLRSKRGDFNLFNNNFIEENNDNNQQKMFNQQDNQLSFKKGNIQLQNNYFKTTYSQTEQNTPHNHKHDFNSKYQNNNNTQDNNYPNRVSEPSKQLNYHIKNKYSTPSQNVSPFKNPKMQELFQPFSYNSSQHDQQLNIQQTTSINSIQSNFKQVKSSINSNQKEINYNQVHQQDNNSQENIQFFKDILQDQNAQKRSKLQSTQMTNFDPNNRQMNDQNLQNIEMTPQKLDQEDEISLESFKQPNLNQQKSYRYSSINFNIPQQINSQRRINIEKPQNADKNIQLSANKSIKQRVSLNPQLISSQNQNGLNNSQVQNFLKKNNNAKLYESPYTQQQRFLKKRQQEKIEQQLRESQYSQQINNSVFQNYHNEAQDINKNPRSQNSQSHKSNKSQEKFDIQKKVTINQPKNYSQAQAGRQIARSPSIQQEALLTTENDENKDFIPRSEQQQFSHNFQMQTEENEDLIQFNRTSRGGSISSFSETKENDQKQKTEPLQTEEIIIFDEKDTDTNHHSQI